MIELDAEKVLSIPRNIRSLEVVRRGFMSNFLFQNIANIFNAPQRSLISYHVFKTMSLIEMLQINPSNNGKTQGEMEGKLSQFLSDRIESLKKLFMQRIYAEV